MSIGQAINFNQIYKNHLFRHRKTTNLRDKIQLNIYWKTKINISNIKENFKKFKITAKKAEIQNSYLILPLITTSREELCIHKKYQNENLLINEQTIFKSEILFKTSNKRFN